MCWRPILICLGLLQAPAPNYKRTVLGPEATKKLYVELLTVGEECLPEKDFDKLQAYIEKVFVCLHEKKAIFVEENNKVSEADFELGIDSRALIGYFQGANKILKTQVNYTQEELLSTQKIFESALSYTRHLHENYHKER